MKFLLLALLLSSCTAGRLIQMACKKDPGICEAKPADTVIFEKPVIITKLDTVYRNDTTVVYKSKDSVILRVVYRAGRIDTVKAECPPKQIITISEPYPVIAPVTSKQKWAIRWKWTALLALSGVGLYLGILALSKGFKPL